MNTSYAPPSRRSLFASLLLSMALAGCAVGPDYVKPALDVPAAFQEHWRPARPADAEPRGAWWQVFGDPQLSAMEEQLEQANPSLQAQEAAYRQAVALTAQARSALFPTLAGNVSASRGRTSGNAVTDHRNLDFSAAWELDLWGAVRRGTESVEASQAAGAADLAALKLSLQAQLAQTWFQLRALDSQRQLLEKTVAAYERSLELTQNRRAAGVASEADVAQAEAQLESTKAQALDIGVQRAQTEHAIALLLGQAPAGLSLLPLPLGAAPAALPPAIPAGLPSQLLERRPDVAAAERRAAAANARIGLEKAAFFPSLTLSAASGWQGSSLANWISTPSRVWSLGPALAVTLFDGGLRSGKVAQARAAHEEAAAQYKQTALAALKEAEDNLAALAILEQEAKVQDKAAQAAKKSLAIAENQYRAGTVAYLNVLTAQSALLTAERTAADIAARRLSASVLLIKALGGGWS